MSVFSPVGSSTLSASFTGATAPVLANVDMVTANQEYSYQFPVGTKQFLIKLRDRSTLKLAYTSGESGLTYLTLPSGAHYSESDLSLESPLDVFFQSTSSAQLLEIVYWT